MAIRLRWLAVLCALRFCLAAASAEPQALPAPDRWPASDIPANPEIVFGTLPNGMRYLIQRNVAPAGAVSFRLRIAAGPLEENDTEEGIAHFLEHMAFRGSKHFADGDALRTLEGMGASRGADANAGTLADSTTFKFDIPKNDDAALDKVLLLLRDIAGEVTLDAKAMDSERAVVLAELRQRDVVRARGQKADLAAVLGQRTAEALDPGGKPAMIERATPETLRRFYQAYYRPERATLVVVGDIDSALVKAKIAARFSDWHAGAPAGEPPKLVPVPGDGPRFALFTQPGAPAFIDLTWSAPVDATPDTVAREHRDFVRLVSLTVLNLRLAALSRAEASGFLAARAAHSQPARIAALTSLTATYAPGKAIAAVTALHQALSRILADGVGPDELAEAVKALRVRYQNAVVAGTSTPSSELVALYLAAIGAQEVICTPDQNLAMFDGAVEHLTAKDATAALRELFGGHSPTVFVSSPDPLEGGEAALAAAFAETTAARTPSTPDAAIAWPYTSFGPPGAAVAQNPVADLGITQISFANGVRAAVKPTKFRAGQVFVSVRFGGGRLSLPKDHKVPAWALSSAFLLGGLGQISVDDANRALAGKLLGVKLTVQNDAFVLTGTTRPADLDSELQLVAAYLSDAAWRPQALHQTQDAMLNGLAQAYATPGSALATNIAEFFHDGDPRWATPTSDEVRATRIEDVKALLQKPLADGPVEVTIVGDVTADDAVRAIAATLGALPRHYRAPAPVKGDERLPPPTATPIAFTHHGAKDQSAALIAWPTTGAFTDMQEQRVLKVLQLILSDRLHDLVRTKEGLTYDPVLHLEGSPFTPSYGYLGLAAVVPPDKIAAFYAAVAETVAALKTTEVPADELDRARGPDVQDMLHMHETNDYWLPRLGAAQADPRWLDATRTAVSGMQQVTGGDVLRAAQTYLVDAKAWKLIAVPKGYSASAK